MKNIRQILRENLEESHATSDNDKKEYIISALDNLSSNDLSKVYDMVESYDPEYEGRTKYKQKFVPNHLGFGHHRDIKHYGDNDSHNQDTGPR